MYQEEESSTFTHHGKQYHLNGVLKLAAKAPRIRVPLSRFDWMLEGLKVDARRVIEADLSAPVVATVSRINGREAYVVLDGTHRVVKANVQRVRELYVRFVLEEDLVNHLVL